jgi:transcriptional regulator with XRE-family HTH domain
VRHGWKRSRVASGARSEVADESAQRRCEEALVILCRVDDATAGRALRALRMRKGWRQEDLGAAAGVSQSAVSRAERGQLATVPLGTVRALFAALDAGCSLAPWWRSGELDRLIDEDHAALGSRAVEFLHRRGWAVSVEVSFAVYGERGSIDLLATRRSDGAVLVVEVKTRLLSVEELLRTLDRKVRLATRIVQERDGWRARVVGRLLVLADDSTNRRRVERASILATALPVRGGALNGWLRLPESPVSGVVFLSLTRGTTARRPAVARQRVRRPRSRTRSSSRAAVAAPVGAQQSPHDWVTGNRAP